MSNGNSAYLPNLTGVRGLAAAWVLMLHAWEFAGAPALVVPIVGLDLTPFAKCGYFGVDLFFVLSGFLLGIPFHRAALQGRPRPSLMTFWAHRCRRVLPAYWLQLVILAAAFLLVGADASVSPRVLVAHVLLIQNIAPWPVPLLNPVYWSMPVEWDFYVVLPLLALLVERCRWPLALLLALVIALGFRLLCYRSLTDPALAAYIGYGNIQQLPARLDQFFVGVCAGFIMVRRPLAPRAALACLAAGIVGIAIMAYVAAPRDDFLVRIDAPYLFFHHSLTAAAFGLLVLGASGPTRLGAALFANRPMTFLGLVSYSLYLWHYPILQVAQFAGATNGAHAPPWMIVLGIVVPAILLVSWLSYRFVERPFLLSGRDAAPVRDAAKGGDAQLQSGTRQPRGTDSKSSV